MPDDQDLFQYIYLLNGSLHICIRNSAKIALIEMSIVSFVDLSQNFSNTATIARAGRPCRHHIMCLFKLNERGEQKGKERRKKMYKFVQNHD